MIAATGTSMQMISEHFSWYEVTHSDTATRRGINNELPPELVSAALNTAKNMERVRALLGRPIIINSWYRGPALQALPEFYNPTSQHSKAEAVDYVSPTFGTPVEIARTLLQNQVLIRFDQLILEHTWVHISFNSIPGSVQRGQVLSLLSNKKYTEGLTNLEGVPYA
jgi:zinc D-Ala-D-Ala carboxypeptidase